MMKASSGVLRPPIVTILGHVDHGKTTLLDTIRKTNVVGREKGGITQSIGASQIEVEGGKKITFIDTPGHAVFAQMRSRGANVSDIAVLVVASDDGVKPQTLEALSYIKEAKIPYIVAASKIDLPSVNKEKVKRQLEKEGVAFEGQGGDVPFVSVSSKTKKGIPDLLEMILLVAEMNEINADAKGELEAVAIETNKDKRGPIVSAVIVNGTIGIGLEISAENISTKVRGLFNHLGRPVAQAFPGDPVQILGFSQLPAVGAKIRAKSDKTDISSAKPRKQVKKAKDQREIPVLIKAKSEGALKDLLANIPDGIFVADSSIGDVVQSDIFTAKASSLVDSSHPARIFAFESNVGSTITKLAETEDVVVERFEIIYQLIERLEELVKGAEEKILGKAEIVAIFPFNSKKVAGCKIITGRIDRSDKVFLIRNEKKLGEVKITSMKKDKESIDNAKEGQECGIIFTPELDFKVGDVILSVTN